MQDMNTDAEIAAIMMAAMESRQRDTVFRRYVDAAVHVAMETARNAQMECDERDIHWLAVTAASTALHMAMDGDSEIKRLKAENERLNEAYHKLVMLSPHPFMAVAPTS